jgi:large subunit ribosomal protein L18
MFRNIKRRRSTSLTNYKKRITMLKSGIDRVVVRRSNRGITAQVVRFDLKGDKILSSAYSRELKAFGWAPKANIPTAYLTGFLLAQKAKGAGIEKCILDIGLYKPIKSSVVFSAAKGAMDNGMPLQGSIEVDEKRLSGSHIGEYAKSAKGEVFSAYKKEGFDVSKISESFEEAKKRIKAK